MAHRISLGRRARPLPVAALAAALALLAVAAPSPAAAARVADASYLAQDPGGLHLAIVVHDRRIEAYACDGTGRRAYFTGGARRARAAIFTTTVRPDGAVTGSAANGGVFGAHLSGLGLVGALALPGAAPRACAEPGFAAAPLHVDGRPVAYPPERAAEALQGRWRWIVTPARVVGATVVRGLETVEAIPAGTKFINLEGDL